MFFSATPKAQRRAIIVAVSLVVAGMALPHLQVGSAEASSSPTTSPKPTIVLVHGAWADSSSWDQVVRRLQQKGYTVDVPPNPLRGLTSDAAYIGSFLKSIAGPVVIVGHSYGGAVITNAAVVGGPVKALVYVNAFIPATGDTVLQPATAQPGSQLGGDPTKVFNLVPFAGIPAGVDLYVKPSLFPDAFANGLPAETAAVLAATQRPIAFNALSEPSGVPAWMLVPSWSLVGTADHVIPPAQQAFMSKRANAHIVEINAPHLSMISDPDAVTDIILKAVV
jgi:pimeloyl-ACP methyl ester carboxylesterase